MGSTDIKSLTGTSRRCFLRWTAAPAITNLAADAIASGHEPREDDDAALLALGHELDRRAASLRPLRAAVDVEGADAPCEAFDRLNAVQDGVMRRIATLPAATLAGYAVKARALFYIYGEDFSPGELGFDQNTTDHRLMWSILSGLAAANVGFDASAEVRG